MLKSLIEEKKRKREFSDVIPYIEFIVKSSIFDYEGYKRRPLYIYSKSGIAEIINIQPLKDGKAKPYQVKQVRILILKYKLNME